MGNEREDKIELRRTCAAIRNGMDEEAKRAADDKICRRILSLSSYRFADAAFLYVPIRSEVDVLPVIRDALARGKTVALPRCERAPGVMTFRTVTGLDELSPGAYGVPEPPEDAPVADAAAFAAAGKKVFLAVPALAFDREGYRLGYGKGYYDRFLGIFEGTAAGIVYDRLIFERLPRGYYDRCVPLLISEGGVRPIRA